MLTILEIIKKTTEFFEKRAIESPRLNAELLVGHALGLKRMQLYLQFERPLTEPELEKIRPLVRRRGNREPLQHIVGTTEFAGLTLKVDPRALIPRPETEHLVGLLLARCVPPPARALDLGTGTGAIALALAKAWPEARVEAVDRSETALALARENATAAGVSERVDLRLSDWFSGLTPGQKYGVIVSNPPYLTAAEIRAATPEVRDHEPMAALDGGREGIEALELILREARGWLEPGALLALETGTAQHAQLLTLAGSHGYVRVESLQDLTGRDRYVLAVV
jgi:release factor glutamine methyltransferase